MREAKVLPIHAVEPGSELAAEIRDRRGNRLFPVGATLSRQQLRKLAEWNIDTLTVWEREDPAVLAAARIEAEETLTHRFRHHYGNALMDELRHAVLAYQLRSLE